MAEHVLSSLTMLTEFFTAEHIEATARRTGFVKRASKITGKLFLALALQRHLTHGLYPTPVRDGTVAHFARPPWSPLLP